MTYEELLKSQDRATALRKHPRHDEDQLQIRCKGWFDKVYCDQHLLLEKHVPKEDTERIKLLLHHSPNEGQLPRSDRDGAKRKAMGVRAGFPDFILLMPGQGYSYLAIELKTPKGRQSESQKAFQKAVEWSGGRYIIVRSLEEFKEIIMHYLA